MSYNHQPLNTALGTSQATKVHSRLQASVPQSLRFRAVKPIKYNLHSTIWNTLTTLSLHTCTLGSFWSPRGLAYSPQTWDKFSASRSSCTDPRRTQLRSSNRLRRDNVATWGLLHRSASSSKSSSNLIHLQAKWHSAVLYVHLSH